MPRAAPASTLRFRMTPEAFVEKWRANARSERAAAQEHFIDLCRLLGEPTPNEADPEGASYAFEKGATKATGGEGWADVWRRGHFALEYKGKRRNLDAAYRQLLDYQLALDSPPLLVVSDIERIVIRTNWTNTVSEERVVALDEVLDPQRRRWLKWMIGDAERLRPARTREAVTREAAGSFAELAARLRARGHGAFEVAHFVNRLVFCLFADDVDLLPPGLFEKMLGAGRRRPEEFAAIASDLFRAMRAPGGRVGFEVVEWFNGGLFDDDRALPLTGPDIALLQKAAALDWGEVDPTIFGTLFERGLDPDKRGELGAHYTDRAMIQKIVEPVIARPWRREWDSCRARLAALDAKAEEARAAKRPAALERARAQARGELRGFLDRLRAFRVLDPACGSGNFLYLALLALKDIELRAMQEAEALGVQREFPQIGPEVLRGIEVNPYAAELARVSVWIGAIQWARRNNLPHPDNPILRPLDTIECRDAVLGEEGAPAPWPEADAIVGNPPFIGDKVMRAQLGGDYVERLRRAYEGRVPGGADFVCYWFERAREELAAGRAKRVGLVATNSIRGGANRKVLERIAQDGRIFDAWDDEPWVLDGAAVRVSLVCFEPKAAAGTGATLNGAAVSLIHPDLTADVANLTLAKPLAENFGVASVGAQKSGAFDVEDDVARAWLAQPANPNGRANSDVVKPWWNGLDVMRRTRNMWIVDFGPARPEREAAGYVLPYAHVAIHVRPEREKSSTPALRENWWLYERSRADMRAKIARLSRVIATPRVSKHRLFAWMPSVIVPDIQLVVIARDDDTTFGVLHSRFHEAWALRLGTSLEDRPRYTPSTTFETFPFPEGLTPDLPAAAFAADPRAEAIAQAARALVAARDRWLHPPEWVEEVAEIVPGLPPRRLPRDARAAQALKARTLTKLYNTRGTPEGRWLDDLHAALDAAVAAAYGWPADLPTEAALARLLDLNRARAGAAG